MSDHDLTMLLVEDNDGALGVRETFAGIEASIVVPAARDDGEGFARLLRDRPSVEPVDVRIGGGGVARVANGRMEVERDGTA